MNYEKPISAFEQEKKEFVTVDDLLSALKGNVFSTSSPQAPVIAHSVGENDEIHLLRIVYKCGSCDGLHFEAGDVNPDEIMINENSVIYADYTHSQSGYVSRKDLIEILEKISSKGDGNIKIKFRTTDVNNDFPLTGVFKCSAHCPSVHLCSF